MIEPGWRLLVRFWMFGLQRRNSVVRICGTAVVRLLAAAAGSKLST